jgi:uncharacterized lipoprotein YddW (UPF0748 family)
VSEPMVKTLCTCLAVVALCAIGSCAVMNQQDVAALSCGRSAPASDCPPPLPREFRAAWVATVANIDWPSKPGLTTAQQQAEILVVVNRAAELNFNALILQVRTSADALYPSSLEPWSEYLTGEQGRAPSPIYDPLKFWIDEAHKRGIEVHAWFNPYRARHNQAKSANARSHLSITDPTLVKSYGGYLWLDPGEARASEHTLNVIMDVVKRYDVDGVHIDDYFYPYPVVATPELKQPGANAQATTANGAVTPSTTVVAVPEKELDFPDEPSWQRYLASGGKLARADWRRSNVNQLVEKIHWSVKQAKPWVRFGISPFGIGKPGKRPAGITGFSQYDKLYADVELWLQRGWLDYLVPQLYWPIDQTAQSFPALLAYWQRENIAQRHIFAGLYTSSINDSARAWQPGEIINQITITRAKSQPNGHVHFSMAPLLQNRKGIADALQVTYAQQAAVPAAPWLVVATDPLPMADIKVSDVGENQRRQIAFTVHPDVPGSIRSVAAWLRYGNQWQFSLIPFVQRSDAREANGLARGQVGSVDVMVSDATPQGPLNAVVASTINRYAVESERRFQSVLRP